MSVGFLNLYKSWYIVTAAVLVIAFLLLLDGALKTRGLVRSSGLLVLYFLYLLLTATWAAYPDSTIWYLSEETIFIAIFALFYLLSLNITPDQLISFFVWLVPPAILVDLITYMTDPEALRLGAYVLVLLPFVLLFCILRLLQSFSVRNLGWVTACLVMLVIGMSRAPLLIAGLGLVLMFITIAKRRRTRIRIVVGFLIISVAATSAILAVPALRINAARSIARITYQDVIVGDEVIPAEKPDVLRWTIYADALSLYETNWLFGMGYMNFMPWFGERYSYSFENVRGKETVGMNLHNVYQTWALEGGLPCVAIVASLLWKYFSILRRRIRQSKNYREKAYYKLFVVAMICLLVEGLFHQIHQTPVLFILLGIVYAFDDNSKRRTPEVARAQLKAGS
jgi:O-Antigen ligase